MNIIDKYIKKPNSILTFVILKNNTDNKDKEDIARIIKSDQLKLINYVCLLDKHCDIVNIVNENKDKDNDTNTNIKMYCDGVMKNIDKLHQDILYIDYGKSINKNNKLFNNKLFIEGKELHDIVNKIGKHSSIIILKVPKKFDFKRFTKNINYKAIDIYSSYNSSKYYIVVNAYNNFCNLLI